MGVWKHKSGSWWISFSDSDGIIRKWSARTTSKRVAEAYYMQTKAKVAEIKRQRRLDALSLQGMKSPSLQHPLQSSALPSKGLIDPMQVATPSDLPKALRHGRGASGSCLTLGSLMDMWTKHLQAANKTKDEVQNMTGRFDTILVLLGGKDRVVDDITADEVDAMKSHLLTKGTGKRMKGGAAPATVNRHLALLKAACNQALDRGKISKSPMKGVAFLDEDNERDRICSVAEFRKLVAAAKDQEMRLMIICGYYTAMRQGEIAKLKWEQVDLESKTLKLKGKDTKTKEGRAVPLHDEVIEALQAMRQDVGPIFAKQAWSKNFAELVKELKISDLRFHDLRHTAITNLRRAGVDLVTIQRISGHKTMAMLARYNTVDASDLVAAVKKL